MSASCLVFGVAVLLLQVWGTHCFPTSACPISCLCQPGPVLNCSSLGLNKAPSWIPESAVSLNISNNALGSLAPLSFGHVKLNGLLHLWVGSNGLESLSVIFRPGTRTLSSGQQECSSWAPDLQLLSAERNHLKNLPNGLGCMKSLQILQLSYNQISAIGLSDLDNCSHLKELHLQHNSITSIHPHAFKDLQQLKVLDLSYNLLVTIPVPAYQSLRNLNALVDVSFNRWKCDCNLQTLRKWISFDTEMGDASWKVVCASPPHHAGKDLLHLNDSELTCPTYEHRASGHYRKMIVEEGMQISIPCGNGSQGNMQVRWWTPRGQAKDNQPELFIKDITEQHAGLYICITGVQEENISVFDLHVYKKGGGSRLRRDAAVILDNQESVILPKNPAVRAGSRTESQFVLAVCLSVIITFILAFILGVFLRPLLDKLWRRIRSKRQSTSSPTSSTEPQPYVNEGYCDVEDHDREVRVGSRVRFGEVTEVEDQMPYYVTVDEDQADGSSESNTEAGGLYEDVEDNRPKQQGLEMERHRGRADSSGSSSLQEGEVNALVVNGQKLPPSSTEDMQFEPIPDETEIPQLKRRGSSSASSHSSQEVTLSSEIRNSTELSVDPSPVANDEIPGFTKEPFSEWPVRLKEQNVDELDPELWNDSGESFSFNGDSERSSINDLSSSALGHPLKDDNWKQVKVASPTDKINIDVNFDKPSGKEVLVDDGKQFEFSDNESSCNSSQSGESVGGPNNYTVNPELEEEIVDESDTGNDANVVNLNRFGTLEDDTFSETMPSAGILIRQETIVLEPSDIHLTFTHGNSVDEGITDDSSMDSSFNIPHKSGLFADMDIDTVPKVKRYVEFKQSKSHSGSLSPSSRKKNILTKEDVISEANTHASFEDNSSLIQREVSADTIQKVKRYIDFKQSDPHLPTLPSPLLTKKGVMLETKRYSLSSDDDAQLTTKDDNSFWTTCIPSDEVSKVKRYISFKQFDTSSPTLSLPKSEATTEATLQTMQPSGSPNNSSQTVKEHMFKQHESRSLSLPSSPTSTRKVLSGKRSKNKKRNDQSFYGSHENLPLYHVHPSYRSSINRLNRGYDTDISFSSEDEDQFIEYPRQLEITTAPGLIGGSIKPGKSKDNVLNIDFDNSSSSTDVFEKKRSKGLMRLRTLGARLFNRNENETDVMVSPADWDAGRTEGVSVNKQSKLTKKQTTDEDGIFGKGSSFDHLPKVKRYIQFSHSYPQAQLPSPPPTTSKVPPDFKVTTESRTSSFSSEDDFKPTTEDETFGGQVDASFDRLPKVKRYIHFSHVEPYSTTLPLKSSPELVVQPESRRSSTSSDEDIKPNEDSFFSKIGVSFDNVPHVKRYIQFNQPKPYSPTQTSSPISIKRPVVEVETSSSTSVKLDDKSDATGNLGQIDLNAVPKVKRYVQFTEFKDSSTPPLVSSSSTKVTTEMEIKTESKIDRFPGDQGNLMQAEVTYENIPKVKRYIQFKHSEPHPTTSDPLHVTPEMIIKSETRRSSTSSEGDVKLTTEEGHVLEETGASLNSVPRVKRYIQFAYPESQPITQVASESVNASVIDKDTRKWSTSSEEDIEPATKENIGETGEYLIQIPKVKRYIRFTQAEPYLSPPSPIPPPITVIETETEFRQPANRESTSSEKDVQEDIGKIVSFDKVPRVKRYIQFTHPKHQSPAQTSPSLSSERVGIPVVDKETRRWSTTSEEDVKPPTEDIKETDEYLTQIPKVKRYIKFTPSEPYSSAPSPDSPSSMVQSITVTETEFKQPVIKENSSTNVQEDNVSGQIGISLDGVPRVKRYIAFTHPETSTAISDERIHASLTAKEPKESGTLSEENVTISPYEDITEDTDEYLVKIPKVKRYIKFKQSESFPSDLLPVPPSSVKSTKVTETELKQPVTRESTSEDDVQEDFAFQQIGVSLDGVPRVKRYIQFTHPESQSLTQSTTAVSAEKVGILGVVQDTRRSSTSSEEDVTLIAKDDKTFGQTESSLEKIPKVKRYIQFVNSESKLVQPTTDLSAERLEISGDVQERRSTTSSEDDVQPSTHDDNIRDEYFDKIPKVKRYIKFTQSESSHDLAPLPISSDVKPVQVTDLQSRGPSTLVDPSPKKDNVFEETKTHLDKVPRVKRYIEFTHLFPVQTTTTLSTDKVATSKVILETSRSSTSTEDEVTIGVKSDYFGQHSEAPLDKIPKVKRYIQFTHPESQFPVQTTAERVNASVVKKETNITSGKSPTNDYDVIKETSVTIPKVKRYIEFTQCQPYSSPQTQLPSVVKPIKVTATEPRESRKSQSTSSDSIPRVKRYIEFTPAESHYSAVSSTAVSAERFGTSEFTEEPKILTTSSKYVKPPATDHIIRETDAFIDNIPKVKRYIEFKQPYCSPASSYLPSSSLSSEPSRPISKKKGSAVIIKTELESWTSDQTGLNSELTKSSSLSSGKQSVGHQIVDEPPAVPTTSPPPLELDAREYLRENSEVRQRQERRRLLQQRRREMDEFNTESLYSMQQEDEKQDRTLADYGGAQFQTERAYSISSTRNNSRSTEGVEAPVLRGLKTKSTSSLDSKSPANSTTKNKEFLI